MKEKKIRSIKEIVIGFIFTALMFFIVDYFASNAHLIVRIGIVLILLLLGHTIFDKLFLKDKNTE